MVMTKNETMRVDDDVLSHQTRDRKERSDEGKRGGAIILEEGNDFNLKAHILRETSDLDSRTSRKRLVAGEVLSVFGVHFSEIVHITHEDSGLDDLGHVRTSLLEDSLNVVEDEVGLSSDGVLVVQLASCRVKRDLTRGEEHTVGLDCLAVGADSLGSLVSSNNDLLRAARTFLVATTLLRALAFTLATAGALLHLAFLLAAGTLLRALAFTLTATGALLHLAFLLAASTLLRAFAFTLTATGTLLAFLLVARAFLGALAFTLTATGALLHLAFLLVASTLLRTLAFTLTATGALLHLAFLLVARAFLGALAFTLTATGTLLAFLLAARAFLGALALTLTATGTLLFSLTLLATLTLVTATTLHCL